MKMPSKTVKQVEGLRERKRRQTRERIVETALGLFLQQGFDRVTVEEIAAAADTTKRTFFDYFPSKESVIAAWQDAFGVALAQAVRQRPEGESLATVVERAFIDSVSAAATPQSIALDRLIKSTETLRTRNQLKYARLEQMLADALMERATDEQDRFRARLLAIIVIGVMRMANEDTGGGTGNNTKEIVAYTRRMFKVVWSELQELGRTATASRRVAR